MRAEKSRITGSFIGLPTNSTTPLRRGGFPGGSDGKGPACNAKDLSSVPGLGRSPGEGNGNLLQYSCLENPRTEEPGGLQFMGSQRVGHDLVTNTFTLLLLIEQDCLLKPF